MPSALDTGVRPLAKDASPQAASPPSPSTDRCWGWLEPAPKARALPYVMLRGSMVCIGRGGDSIDLASLSFPASRPDAVRDGPQPQTPSMFVEIADGRVSRAHCLLFASSFNSGPALCDVSSNGTFLNGRKLGPGAVTALEEGDQIAVVASVSPLAEEAFIFHEGRPLLSRVGVSRDDWVGWAPVRVARRARGPRTSPPPPPPAPRPGGVGTPLRRSATSAYLTADAAAAEPSALQCQICLDALHNAVALEPCGHTFCAGCLSPHLSATFDARQDPACPLRCAAPSAVVVNAAVRELVRAAGLERGAEGGGGGSDAVDDLNALLAEFEYRDVYSDSEGSDGDYDDDSDDLVAADTSGLNTDSDEEGGEGGALARMVAAMVRVESLGERHPYPLARAAAALTVLTQAVSVPPGMGVRHTALDHRAVRAVLDTMHQGLASAEVCTAGCAALRALTSGADIHSILQRAKLVQGRGSATLLRAMECHGSNPGVQLDCMRCLAVCVMLGSMPYMGPFSLSVIPGVMASARRLPAEPAVCVEGMTLAAALVRNAGADAEAAADLVMDSGLVELASTALWEHGGYTNVFRATVDLLGAMLWEGERGVLTAGSAARLSRLARPAMLSPLMGVVKLYKRLYGVAEAAGARRPPIMDVAETLESLLMRTYADVWLRWVTTVVKAAMAVGVAWMAWRTARGAWA